MEEKTKKNKAVKVLKTIGIIVGIICALLAGIYFYITSHPQIIVGMIQKEMYHSESCDRSFVLIIWSMQRRFQRFSDP